MGLKQKRKGIYFDCVVGMDDEMKNNGNNNNNSSRMNGGRKASERGLLPKGKNQRKK